MSYIPSEVINEVDWYKKEGDYEAALNVLNWFLSKDPTNQDLLLQIADIESAKWELSRAEKPIDIIKNDIKTDFLSPSKCQRAKWINKPRLRRGN